MSRHPASEAMQDMAAVVTGWRTMSPGATLLSGGTAADGDGVLEELIH